MTTKQLAEYIQRPEKTVRTWAKKASAGSAMSAAKMAEAQKSRGIPVDWDLEEIVSIITVGMGANAAAMYRASAHKPDIGLLSSVQPIPTDSSVAFQMMASAFEKLVRITENQQAMLMDQNVRLGKIENRIEERAALLPAPQIKPRDHVNQIVRKYAERVGMDFSSAWTDLYREFGYRTNSAPKVAAKNRDMGVLDYLESEGLIETLEAVALEWAK
jgi:hypothetical protein